MMKGVGLDVVIRRLPNGWEDMRVSEYKKYLPSGAALLWVDGEPIGDGGMIKLGDLVTFDCIKGTSLGDVRHLF